MLRLVAETVRSLAPDAAILPARFGLTGEAIEPLPAPVRAEHPALHLVHDAGHSHAGHDHDHDHDHDALGLASWSTTLTGDCNADELQNVLHAVVQGAFGQSRAHEGCDPRRCGLDTL